MAMTPFRSSAGSNEGNNSSSDGSKNLERSMFDGSNFKKPLDLWDPLEHMNALWKDSPMGSLFHDVKTITGTRMDWKETKDAHIFKADLPGLTKNEVKLTIEDGRLLQITGERSKEKEEKTDTWHRVERSQGQFMRRFHLPENADIDKIQAKVENGVLTVTIAKTDRIHRPVQRQIDIK